MKLFVDGGLVDSPWTAPGVKGPDGKPVAIYLASIQPGTNAATFLVSLPGFSGVSDVPIEVTYKPWINLVWIGVLMTVAGALIAMIRRSLEARKLSEETAIPARDALPPIEAWENIPDVEPAATPAAPAPQTAARLRAAAEASEPAAPSSRPAPARGQERPPRRAVRPQAARPGGRRPD
jgi:hypothetical protein